MSLRPRNIDFDPTWSILKETVSGVIMCGSVPRVTWNDRFSDVYALCVSCPEPHGDRLYQETKVFLEKHVQHLYKIVTSRNQENLLTMYQRYWEQYSKGSSYLNQLYGYLNTTFIKKQKYTEADLNYGGFSADGSDQMLEIGELALDTWKKYMIETLKDQLVVLILQEIQSDRQNNCVNQTVLHSVITSLVEVEHYKKKCRLQLYEEVFESPFLKETGDYYRSEAAKLKNECTCSEYMEKVLKKVQEEEFRSRKFLHPSSYVKVTIECQQRMVADHLMFLHGECREMVQTEKLQDLENMFTLLKPMLGAQIHLVQEVEDHIKNKGMEAVQNLKGDNVANLFVENMLNVHSKYSGLIKKVFRNDQVFVGALDKACAVAINFKAVPRQPCRSPELLAKYCDNLLKKSSKGSSEAELDDKLCSCITVFKYLDDKDVYQRHYARMLAKRLIHGQTASMDAEEVMINKLKQACGYEFTNKLHRMFTDMSVSSGLLEEFITYQKESQIDLGLNFSTLVLQAGAWPLGQGNLPSFAIPQELEKSVSEFEKFYNKKYNGRKLTWMHSLCTVELKFNYLKKPYIVTMGSFQMALLLCFNASEKVSFKEAMQQTRLSDQDIIKQFLSLVDAKLLTVQGEIDTNSVFELNMSYTNKRTKFKIAAAVHKESAQEVELTRSAVDEDRKIYMQAAIVRIMKARKQLKHNTLIEEVINQAKGRFAPNISMIKKCIEALIDKEYLERTQNSADEYSYIA